MNTLSDTSPEAEAVLFDLIAKKPPAERLRQALNLSTEVMNASKRAIARVHPEFSPQQVGHMFIELHYGKALADAVRAADAKRAGNHV